jgi:GDP-D-mannose 3',5'-epimerase
MRIAVTGAGGFIGTHLVRRLKADGHWVRGVDIKPLAEWRTLEADENLPLDLRFREAALLATVGVGEVYALAANMGGAGYVFTGDNDLEIMRDNTLININTLEAARINNITRYFFSSSACLYPQNLQQHEDAGPLKESDALPANPDSSYGWEKLYAEILIAAYQRKTNIKYRLARFHNIFGPLCDWVGGREKFPAAACRRIAIAKLTGNHVVEVWGNGKQVRSFCYIDNLIEMLCRLMSSEHSQPMNLGSDRAVSVNEVYDILMDIANIQVELHYIPGPIGVRGRNANLSQMKKILDYESQVSLEEGLFRLYNWIEPLVKQAYEP